MRNGQTLNLAIEFMQKKRDDMARQWQVLRQDADSAQERLNLLASYAQESQTRWEMRSRNATPQILMQQHFKVIDKLESAIGMQKEVLADKELKCTHKRQLWTEAEQRVQILQRYQNRCFAQHQAKVLKMEQKQTDEFAIQWGHFQKLKVPI
jgi:flagellar FliJ protein